MYLQTEIEDRDEDRGLESGIRVPREVRKKLWGSQTVNGHKRKDNVTIEIKQKDLHSWRLGLKIYYPDLVCTSSNVILPFISTYLYEVAFPAMSIIKTNYKNNLELEPDLRTALTGGIKPDFPQINQHIHYHRSH
ncbi:hypothetical protein NPIL_580651 [Nephila pilipes]|uniref:Uncharacterized protein n=1 Tax=Nephila pilipes TaxID=299642 RepID=A0A8X6MK67_NEPPI|nr:hypothetical protein NPIL_580651 [Nephila pilipes]